MGLWPYVGSDGWADVKRSSKKFMRVAELIAFRAQVLRRVGF